MATFSCLLWVYRLEFPGVDYVGAFADYLFTIPVQLVVAIAGPLLLVLYGRIWNRENAIK